MTEQSGDQQTLKLGDKVYSYTEEDGVIEYNIVGIRLYNDATFYEIEHGDVKLLIVDNSIYKELTHRMFEYTNVLKDDKYTVWTNHNNKYPKLYYVNKDTAIYDYINTINSRKWNKIHMLQQEAERLLSKVEKIKQEIYASR